MEWECVFGTQVLAFGIEAGLNRTGVLNQALHLSMGAVTVWQHASVECAAKLILRGFYSLVLLIDKGANHAC